MDDSCAVCADTLEWVAYGACGHREVCSTCVVRLRFICGDRRCCICKTESPVVFITKALGDYTRMISDFAVLPSDPREGRVGTYSYHEDSQAFFDDVDHYKMIKAMCRLSCSVCDKMEEEFMFLFVAYLPTLAVQLLDFWSCFIFQRHNTMEHGGRMSRAQRSAALQIPTSFRYRRSSEQDHRRGRGRTFQRDQYDNQLSIAIQASLETSHSEGASHEPSSSSSTQLVSDHGDANDIDPLVQPFELLTATDSEMPSRYLQALGQGSRSTPLEESSFPPLMNTSNSQQPKQESEGLTNNTMAAHLRRQTRNATILSSAQPWPAPRRGNASGSSVQYRPNNSPAPSVSRNPGPVLSAYASSIQSQAQARPALIHGPASSPGNLSNVIRITHSASAPNLSGTGSLKPSISDFPPVSATQIRKTSPSNQVLPKVDDVHTANKSLVEKIRAALEYDEDKYAFFKDVSGQYRQGSIDTEKYLHYVREYGLSHLVLELARLCPDAHKQKELVDTYNASLRSNGLQENGWGRGGDQLKDSTSTRKGKKIDGEGSSLRDRLADNILSTVRTLQTNYKSPEEEVEVLSKDGYRGTKGKAHVMVDERQVELRSQNDATSAGNGSNQNGRDAGSGNRQRKKTSKFHRVRLGDGSMAALFDLKNSEPDPDPDPNPVDDPSDVNNNPSGGLPVRGVWRKGGGHKLFP
eukprot:XP_015572321.1 uncharacterized protein LOC8265902 [Ricinus communis]